MTRFALLTLSAAFVLAAAPTLACDGPGKDARRAEVREQAMAEADADGNGALSAEEFEVFQAAVKRARASRRFAKLDANDDGQLTVEELEAPRGGR